MRPDTYALQVLFLTGFGRVNRTCLVGERVDSSPLDMYAVMLGFLTLVPHMLYAHAR